MQKISIKFSFVITVLATIMTFADHAGAFTRAKQSLSAAVDCYTRNLTAQGTPSYSDALFQSCTAAIADLVGKCLTTSPNTPIDETECSGGSYFCCAKITRDDICPIPIKPEGLRIGGYKVTQVFCKTMP